MNTQSGIAKALDLKMLGALLLVCSLVLIFVVVGISAAQQAAAEPETGGGSSVVIEALNIASHLTGHKLDGFKQSVTGPLPIPGLNPKYSTAASYFTELNNFFF